MAGFGPGTPQLEAMLQEMANMSPGDLADLLDEQEEKADDIDDGHLVEFVDACRREHLDTFEDRRNRDDILWQAHETQLAEMGDKEDWQSKIVLNRPFTTVIQAKSLVRRGLMERPEYFGLLPTDDADPIKKSMAKFWEKGLGYWANTRDAYVPHAFADSSEMGFTVGSSMGTKVLWEPDENGVYRLKLVNIEPWKLLYDPDRLPRQPWSGLYNIHEDFVPLYVLREKERQGAYEDIDRVVSGKQATTIAGAYADLEDKESKRRKTGQKDARNKFRKEAIVQEFWGSVLDENGDLAITNCSFTVANGIVIRKPKPKRYRRMRWPWVENCPLPHLINWHGYGIYESVLALWKFQNALLNLYIDNENWRINNMFEIDISMLANPSDLEIYPMKQWIKKRGAQGSAITPVLKGDNTVQEVMAMWGLISNLWENGSFITELMKGDAGSKREKTATEVQAKLQQSMGVFDSIGKDVEKGGEDLLWAMKEVLTTYWDDFDQPGLKDVFGNDPVYQMLLQAGAMSPDVRMEVMDLDCQVRIEGVSRLFDRENLIQKIQGFMAMTNGEDMLQFRKPYVLITKLGESLNLSDAVVSEEELNAQQAQRRQQALEQIVQASVHHGVHGGQPQPQPGQGGQPGQPAAPAGQPAAAPAQQPPPQ